MAARTESADFSVIPPVRWLLWPALGWAVITAFARTLRRRAQEPSVPPMSEEWLRDFESTSGRSGR